jgi:choline dehydrogenase
MDEYDYVVVGGGSAGAIVGARLAERGDATVCLVEAGPADEGDERVLDVRRWTSLVGTELVRDFAIEPQQRGNSELLHSRAYVLGGCGSHNQAIAFAPPARDLRAWVDAGATGWAPDGLQPALQRVLQRVHVESAPATNACAAAFVASAGALGIPTVGFEDADVIQGAGWWRLNVLGTRRQSSSVAYLHPLGRHDRLDLRTQTRAHRLVVSGGRAVAVETDRGTIGARYEIVVSCGALESPKLLLLSGIGPAQELRRLGIGVVADVPGVGQHFLDHPEATVIHEASRPVATGVLTGWEAGLLARTAPRIEAPDVQIHFGTMPAEEWAVGPGRPTAEHAFWLTPNVARPRSEGRLGLRSADPDDPPRIDPGYYTDPEGYDETTIVRGLRLARRIAAEEPLARWAARELLPGEDAQTDVELAEYARLQGATVQHPAGTCRMGAIDDALAVVDPQLRVRGIAGLRVADASVFPTMLGVNINLTCMAIGERCAELLNMGETQAFPP